MEELGRKLEVLGIDDEDMVEYFQSLLDDEEQDEGSLCEFAADYCDDEELVKKTVAQIWSSYNIEKKKMKKEGDDSEKHTFDDILQAHANKLKELDKMEAERAAQQASSLTAEEKAAIIRNLESSEALSDEDENEEDDEDAIPSKPLSEKKERQLRKTTSAQEYSMGFVNTNREALDHVRQQKIDQQRKQAHSKASQDKTALATDKQNKASAKEARRAKTQKQERRR
eukprot:m.27317 g.27317  ORF g.27317 m.27317 type:complete len:227 (-) comp5930_c0_seq2:110-790(-)